MKENKRLQKLIADHFTGDPWIEVQIWDSIKGLDPSAAAQNIGGLNSIWQIVHHMASWRETIVKRLKGVPAPTPNHNYFEPIPNVSPTEWEALLNKFRDAQHQLLDYLNGNIDMDEILPGAVYSRYELLQGILQHDAYHLGQIILIKKLLITGFAHE